MLSLFSIFMAACAPAQGPDVSTSTAALSPAPGLPLVETPIPTAVPTTGSGLVIAFIKDGNIQLWNESNGQTQTLVNAGDVIAVTMSDDGQVIAFLRRSAVQVAENEWREQSALWAVDRNGANPRELVTMDSLRQRLNAAERDSTNIPQLEWIPGTHKLLFSGWTYFVMAEGESHAIPQGLYLVDADARTDSELVPAGSNFRFVPSPDGSQIALMSTNALSFINTDGSNRRQDVLTYPTVGLTAPLFPTGVWTQDSSAFLITGSLERDASSNINFSIWRILVNGSSSEIISTITGSDPSSVTFSPDGQRAAFVQFTQGQVPTEWYIASLYGSISPLAIPQDYDFDNYNASLHWSPAGDPFTKNLRKLCPEATRDTDECDTRISFYGTVSAIRWIDGNRLLFLTREPSVLYLAKMDFTGNMSGTTIPIAAWPLENWVSIKSFTMANVSQ
jgi:dipeptidyl aminopeptidase/acylaminoacyl peptidase